MSKCSVRVGGENYSALSGSPCRNPAKVERDGKFYCGMHDPDAIKGRREQRSVEAHEKWEVERERQRRQGLILTLTYGIRTKVFEQKAREIREFLETL